MKRAKHYWRCTEKVQTDFWHLIHKIKGLRWVAVTLCFVIISIGLWYFKYPHNRAPLSTGPTIHMTATECQPQGIHRWLKMLTQQLIVGGEVRVGHMGEIQSLLRWARTPETDIETIMDIIRKGLDGTLDDPILSETVSALMKSQEDFRLTLCILSEACKFGSASTAASYVGSRRMEAGMLPLLEVAHLPNHALSNLVQQGKINDLKAFGIRDTDFRRALLVQPNRKVPEDVDWVINIYINVVGQFFHEATHYADDLLFTDWVLANKKLIAAGQKPGYLFRKIMRTVDGQIYTSEEFYKLFTEIRAYHVMAYLFILLQGISPSSDLALEIREMVSQHGYNYLVSIGAKPFLDAFSFDPLNIFNYRTAFAKIMREDIQAAQSL